MSVRAVRLGIVALLLGTLTACLEHFGELVTRVSYDPVAQTFEVERRLIDVQPAFLGCHELDGCIEAIERAMTVQPAPVGALSDRLLQRLTQSGATDLTLELDADGDRLDVIVRYRAPVGTGAADDTLVRAEWDGKGDRGRYYLVLQAQDSLEPPKKYRSRKVARSGPSGVEWIEEWVLPPKQLDVETSMAVGQGEALFATVPGLRDALADRGWLDGAVAPPEPAPAPDPEPEPEPEPVAVPVPDPEPPPAPAPAPTVSLAKTYVYEARISGGGLSASAAELATEPLVPRVSRCYQDRQAQVADLGGSAFLSALVRADGSLVSTSVYGQIEDPPLLRCLEQAIEAWRFPAWGSGEGVSDVAIPIVFRVEEPPPTRGRKKKR